VKSASPCLNNLVVEVTDIGHRKEDSDRVLVHEESLYSRLQKDHSSRTSETLDHVFCIDESRQHIVTEESSIEISSPLRLTEIECTNESNGDSMEEERAIPDLTVEIDPKTIDSVNSSSYKKGHYSTNACDSIQLSSTSQTHVQQRLHNVELVPEDSVSHPRDHDTSPIRNEETSNELCDADEDLNCANKRSKICNGRLSSMNEQDYKTPNEELSCKYKDNDLLPVEERKVLQIDLRKRDILHETSTRLNDECFDVNSQNVKIIVQKYTVDKEVESESCETPVVAEMAASYSNSVKFCGLHSEDIEIKTSTGNLLQCHSNTVQNQKEGTMTESEAYITNVETDIKPITTTLCTTMDSRINITGENNATDFSNIQNYNDLADHSNVEETSGIASIKRSRRKDHALDASSRSSRKSQKKSKSKSKHGRLAEGIQDDANGTKSQNKIGKNKNKSTRSQRRDRQRPATAEIGEADDDSGIQGDIYEFSEKESNLEDIGMLSIIRRGKHESRHASSLIVASSVQEMQCNDDYNKAEPPVLVPEEPWPPSDSTTRREHGTDLRSNGVQSEENRNVEESLER